ncbi:hypothetical protein AXF42_Ash008649 [Apostasia shenzhenica]|uniref:Repressor of RNA polymerase III transcription n=1 Tax=Apostasia shenzhenica TaxID=1088818 RepID=A0A2I0B205_9ASPA|nr:hypothetical protein AXF42_Ash008649 [Apostasia shenzhenica]
MKFLEFPSLDSINLFLGDLYLGETTIRGCLEVFSCKHTATDRRLSFSLEQEMLDYLGQSSESASPSPVEHLISRSSRKTRIYLVLALSHMYPDYDFSAVKAHLFFKDEELETFRQMFDTYLFEAAKKWDVENEGGSLLESSLKLIDEVVRLSECEIHSYKPDFEGDPFLEKGAIWSFNFFFYNRKLKRIVSFRCCASSNLPAEIDDDVLTENEVDYDLLSDMEM